MTTRLISLAVLLAIVMLSPASQGGSAELASPVSDELKQLALTRGKVRVIVHLNAPFVPELELSGQAEVMGQRQAIAATQAFVRSGLRGVQHRVARQPSGLPFLAVELDADGLRALEAQRGVVKLVEEDKLERPHLFQSVPLIRADDVFTDFGVDGTGTLVAILDTGVAKNHPFFGGRVAHEACFSTTLPGFTQSVCPGGAPEAFGNNAGLNCAASGCDHGTHVAGIAAGGSAGAGGSGVAPGARIIAIQVFSQINDAGFCAPDPSPCVAAFSSDIIEALNHVFGQRNAFLPDVIASVNLSLGGTATLASCPEDPRKPAVDQLKAAGIATVIASGNEFKVNAISPPGCIPTAVSVGATTKQDIVAGYSNSASALDLLAPGGAAFGVPEDDILSSVPPNLFDFKAGTSMAAPHVAGAFALMRQAHSQASVDALLNALKTTGFLILDTRSGVNRLKPRINVRAAIDAVKADLVPTALTGPTNIAAGATYTVKFSVKNTGASPAAASDLGVFISSDNSITLGDVALGSTPVPALNPGATFSGSIAVTVPSNTAAGPIFFGVIADVNGDVDEATEANNSRASAAAVVVRPDYAVQSVLASLLAAAPGSNFTVTHTVRNVAGAPNTGPASLSELFFSADNVLDGGDVSLGTVPVPALIAGAAAAPKRTVQVPPGTPVGLYWIFARANTNNTIIEAGTGANNVGVTAKPLIVGPDLLPTAPPLTPTAKVPGASFSVATTVKNQGGQAAGAFDVNVYLSTDATFDGADVLVGTRRVTAGLAPAATSTAAVLATIPGGQPVGPYFLLVRADAGDEVTEADETNNVRATAKQFIVGTDLIPAAAPVTPAAKAPGAIFSVATAVKNQGGLAASGFDVTVYLSTDATFDGGDVALGTRRVNALAAGATSTGPVVATIPGGQPAGAYFLLVRVDAGGIDVNGEVPEADETNNERATAKAFIVATDLIPTAAPLAPAAKAPGAIFGVATAVKNQGGLAAGGFDVTVYLSTDATFDGGDVAVGTRRVNALAAGATSTGPVQAAIPGGQQVGLYFLLVRADAGGIDVNGEVPEASETNNERASATRVIVGPDLKPTAATRTPAATAPGRNVSVATTVKNRGAQPTGSSGFDITVYLSTDATFDAGVDVAVGTRRIAAGLAAGAEFTGQIVATVPANQAAGDYFLLVRADDSVEVSEADETNNVRSAGIVRVVRPDLATTAVTVKPLATSAGMNVTVTTTVRNLAPPAGRAAATTLRLYLSSDNALDVPGDATLLNVPIPALAGGTQATVIRSVQIPPATLAGTYFIIAQANALNTIVEVDSPAQVNNIRPTATFITVGP